MSAAEKTLPIVVPADDPEETIPPSSPPPPPPPPHPTPSEGNPVVTWGSSQFRACVHLGAWTQGKACAICYSLRDQEARANQAKTLELWLVVKALRFKLAQIATILARPEPQATEEEQK